MNFRFRENNNGHGRLVNRLPRSNSMAILWKKALVLDQNQGCQQTSERNIQPSCFSSRKEEIFDKTLWQLTVYSGARVLLPVQKCTNKDAKKPTVAFGTPGMKTKPNPNQLSFLACFFSRLVRGLCMRGNARTQKKKKYLNFCFHLMMKTAGPFQFII